MAYMSESGYNQLLEELKELETVQRPEISRQIAEARDKGDLSENAEYDAAKEAQGMLEMKISQLKDLVANARIIDEKKLNTEEVQILNRVKIKNVANGKIAGAGGFINITQNTKHVVFCGTFTAGGLKTDISNGVLSINKEGKKLKFVKEVEQITFSGKMAVKNKQNVYYVTERAVFKLIEGGVELIEIAPGINLEKDILELMAFKPIISKDLKIMDKRIFSENKMNLK